MKSKIAFITLLAISITLLGLVSFQSSIGPHNGTIKNAGSLYCIELRTDNRQVCAYLLDKKFKSIGNKGVLCEIKFLYADSTTYTKTLIPVGMDGFSTEIGATSFCSCRVFFNISGRIASAKFENPNLIVQKN